MRIFCYLLFIFRLFDDPFWLIIVDLINILRTICICFLFDIDSINIQHFCIWLIYDDRWGSLLLISIFRTLIINWLIFYRTFLHWRLYLFYLLIEFIKYSMLLPLVLWACNNFSIS